MKLIKFAALALAFAIAICSAASCSGKAGQTDPSDTEAAQVADSSSYAGRHDDPQVQDDTSGSESAAPGFTLTDQYGAVRSLSDYRGKVVFINFWATWCPPCRSEMPDIQALYEKYGDDGEVAVLGVAFPNRRGEYDSEGIAAFLKENGYSYPVLMDETASLIDAYNITAYPTTFMIDRDGNVFGYVAGALTPEFMQSIIDQTLSGVRED